MTGKNAGRIWEIDFLRGIALLLMIIFHLLFNLKEFYGYPVQYNSGVYFYIGKLSAILFMVISAISSSFSRNNVRRGVKFLAVGMLITAASHLYNPDYGIKFGILHFIGTCILLYPLFRGLNKYLLPVLGTIVIILGQYLDSIYMPHNYLFIFNLTGSAWVSADYYPLLPWLGVFLYGIALGKFIYPERKSLFSFTPPMNPFSYLGEHTLFVYLVHQPLLLMAISLYKKITG